ncbi:MAG: hydroxyacylglutathione hydrolase [Candidatus Accumulibacter phosphatis]|uniref:Hydroxyacylglutathione hydrolase n=1 Tax=Candidatus Accumulibacter phosphatis TaxID=327160 RepID=A0A080M0K4_9PROT|nr:MAG: hydroxyacylglutathione hydrolase [Candidatus Accumulibacter phosphatis]
MTHAAQTVALLEHALAGRRLTRLLNTHSHSDHIGGNAAVTRAFGCQVIVPQGIDATIAEWERSSWMAARAGRRQGLLMTAGSPAQRTARRSNPRSAV